MVKPRTPIRLAILDDYQDVALTMADWGALPQGVDVSTYRDHLAEEDALVERLGEEVLFYKLGLELFMAGGYFDRIDWLGEKGKKDKSRREDKKKPKLTIKEKRKLKKEKKKEKWN